MWHPEYSVEHPASTTAAAVIAMWNISYAHIRIQGGAESYGTRKSKAYPGFVILHSKVKQLVSILGLVHEKHSGNVAK